MSLSQRQILDAVIEGSDILAGHTFKVLGSSTIEGATVADVDFLAFVSGSSMKPMMETLLGLGFSVCSENYNEPDCGVKWMAMRHGHINIILTIDYQWYVLFCRASYVCKELKLLDKEQRKLVHRIIRDNEYPLDLQ